MELRAVWLVACMHGGTCTRAAPAPCMRCSPAMHAPLCPARRPAGVLHVSVRTQWLQNFDAREADAATDISYMSWGQSGGWGLAPVGC